MVSRSFFLLVPETKIQLTHELPEKDKASLCDERQAVLFFLLVPEINMIKETEYIP